MTRRTDTRERVRALAQELANRGLVPTPGAIREQLGGGSPNTIVDELRKWRESQQQASNDTTGHKHSVSRASESVPCPSVDHVAGEPLLRQMQALVAKVDALTKAVEQQGINTERLDDAQRRALLLIDEARGRGRYWEEEARRLRVENREKEEHYRQAMYRALDECNVLRGRLEEARALAGQPPLQVGADAAEGFRSRVANFATRSAAYDVDGKSSD